MVLVSFHGRTKAAHTYAPCKLRKQPKERSPSERKRKRKEDAAKRERTKKTSGAYRLEQPTEKSLRPRF